MNERGDLLARIRALAGEYAAQSDSPDARQRREGLESEASETARRYVESHPLYATRDPEAAYTCILELAVDLIGARRLAVYLDDGAGMLQPRACAGAPFAAFPSFRLGQDLHANSLAGAMLPLEVLDRTLGAIMVYDAPTHGRFTPLEYAVLAVLSRHAAITATAQFYAESAHKCTTIQGFIDLLTG